MFTFAAIVALLGGVFAASFFGWEAAKGVRIKSRDDAVDFFLCLLVALVGLCAVVTGFHVLVS